MLQLTEKPTAVPPKPKRLTMSVSPEDMISSTQSGNLSNHSSKSSPVKKPEVDNMSNIASSKPSSVKSQGARPQKQRYGTRTSPASSPKTRRKTPEKNRNSPRPTKNQLNENHNYGPLDMNTQWMINYP